MRTPEKLMRRGAALALCAFATGAAFAADWYVDDANGDDTYDGRTALTAKKTIQAAVDCAAKNDTVKVAEGVYEGENAYGDSISACVVISNNLTLVATGSKDRTHVVGRHADTSTGVGEGAVRCIYVKEGVKARIEGFTIRDGAASTGNGGGVTFSAYNKADGWLVDCVVSNCVAGRGGALWYGTAIRCLFSGNDSTSYGQVALQSILYNCLVVGNVGAENLFCYPQDIVNCTIAGNSLNNFSFSTGAHSVCNTIFLENAKNNFGSGGYAVLSNCLVTAAAVNFNQAASGLCATNDTEACFTAPAIGDWRPRRDSGAAGLGDASHLARVALPDESMRYVDYAGKPIPQSGPIACGAIQETVSPGSGVLALNGPMEIDGLGVADSTYCNYLHATNYPCMYKMKAVGATISNIVWYSSTTGLPVRVPMLDGWVGVMPPPAGAMTLSPVYAKKILYADAENGDDGYAGDDIGSWDHPYKTLQAAFEAAPNGRNNDNLAYSVICAKPGDYKDGGTVGSTISYRLFIDGFRRVRVVALGGPEVTIIRGESPADAANGLPCSCVNLNVPSLVQGFTLTDGHSTDSSSESGTSSGSALSCALNVSDRMIADCIVSNNVSSFCAQRGGTSLRCVFLDNIQNQSGGGDMRSGYAVHNVFRPGDGSHSAAFTLGSNSRTFLSTYSGKIHSNATRSSLLEVSPACNFLDASADDYRLRSDSPAFGAGDADPESYWMYANLDRMGNPLCFVGGRPTAGAYQRPSAVALAVDVGSGNVTVDGAETLTNAVLPGASVTIAKSEGCGRNLLGYTLPDGSFVSGPSYSYTAPAAVAAGRLDVVAAVFSTNWYVNAGALGGDSKDGFTAETPKKTLAGVMAAELAEGDVVHAAAGEYAEGIMYNTDESGRPGGAPVIGSRVVVPRGVTLVSDEGADLTHIVGSPASAEYDVQLGLGSNAVRCAFVSTGARLKGFTLRDGRTNGREVIEDAASGGGVLGVSSTVSFVEDCVISNCIAVYGAAGYGANFKRCRFFHNRAVKRSSVTRVSWHDSCIADWNWGARPFDYFTIMTNCTIGAHQIDEDGNVGNGYCLVQPMDINKTSVIDCLVLGRIHAQVKMRRTAALSTSGVQSANCEDCILTNLAALAVDDDYRPVIGENAAIDAIPLAADGDSIRGVKDASGAQRVFNGARDLGALEADWRPRYAKTLGGRRIEVTAADPAVVETAGAVRIPEGSVELVWRTPEGREIPHAMGMTVSGGGTLSVDKDGTAFAAVTEAASGVRTFNAAGAVTLRFSYAADDAAAGYAELSGFSAPLGFVLHVW